jgi:hypothetical protein
MLREMLKNVTLALPGGYDLIAGLHPNNVLMYYEVIQTVMLANLHGFKLVMNVPLNSMNKIFFCTEWLFYPRVFQIILLFNLRLKKIILELILYKDVT